MLSDDNIATFSNSSYAARPMKSGDNHVYSRMTGDKFAECANISNAARPTGFKASSRRRSHSNRCMIISIVMLFMCVAMLVLCVMGAWIFFALETNKAATMINSLDQQVAQHLADIEDRFISLENSTRQIANYTQSLGNLVNTLYRQVGHNFSSIDNILQQLQCSSTSSSCSALPPSSPSGYYCIRATNGSAVHVYCDMTRSCGGVTGGWMRVAALDMTNRSQECPSALIERQFTSNYNLRTCSRPEEEGGCNSLHFSSNTITYSKMCGSVIAYQYGALDAFRGYHNRGGIPLDGNYVSGVSITRGTPRQHVWTFVAARDELVTHNWSGCDCLRPNYPIPPTPPYVGNDYFCDSGSRNHFDVNTFYGDDPLWDGAGCESVRGFNNSCCTFNNPPWFYKQLSQPTTDDIELRVCRHVRSSSDLFVKKFEIYVQ